MLAALAACADPDLALHQLHRIAEAVNRAAARVPAVAPRWPPRTRTRWRPCGPIRALRVALAAVLGASIPLGDDMVANPDRWQALTEALDERDPYAGRSIGSPAQLRTAYRSALLRIAAADLTHAVDVEVSMARLSRLADATMSAGLRLAQAERGATPRLAVVAMGKCGGRELNYVSDVDVIFVCAQDRDLADSQAIAARMMQICAQAAWPVDANLRPEGSRGPLVRTLASHEAYYQRWARTWEFQALLKARPAAGDLALGAQWLAVLEPLIWRAAERPEAVEDVRAMRRRIIDNVPAARARPGDQAGPGWVAGYRVRRATVATRARPWRRGAPV